MALISKGVDSVCLKVLRVNVTFSKRRISEYKGKLLI